MPFVPALNTVLAEIRMLCDSQSVENTLYFQLGNQPDPATMATLGENLIDWWVTNIAPLTSDVVVLKEVVITDLTTNIGPQTTSVPSVATTGEQLTELEPNNVSLAISFRTVNRGRSFRGRNYFVGLTGDQVVQNRVLGTFIESLVDAYELLLGSPFAPSWQWSVVSRFFGVDPVTKEPIPRTAAVITPITTVVVVDNVVDSQRRRLPGRGK